MTASIKEVARKAGVSAGTVSNVFSGNRAVRPDLVERVRSAVADLGYEPDRAASQLRAGKARVVAALVPDLNNPLFTSLIAAIESRVREDGLNIIVASSNEDPAEEKTHLRALLAWRPAGLLVVPCSDEFDSRALISRAGVPFVVADRVPLHFDGDAVLVDNIDAGRQAAEHLMGLGHRDIVVAASTLKLQNIRDRREGIYRVFKSRGLPVPSVIEVGLDFDTATERLGRFMEQAKPPTAFLALTNFGTLGVLAALQKRNLSVPRDVSVVGFDDYSWMRAVTPPITVIRQPVTDMASDIWAKLRARMAGDAVGDARTMLRCALITRASTAPLVAVEPVGQARKKRVRATDLGVAGKWRSHGVRAPDF